LEVGGRLNSIRQQSITPTQSKTMTVTDLTTNASSSFVSCSTSIEPNFSCKAPQINKSRIFDTCHIEKLQLDISAHICPKRFIKELQYIFPNCDLTNVIVIPTMQFAKNELVNIGDEIEVEKDRLLERVSEDSGAQTAHTQITSKYRLIHVTHTRPSAELKTTQ
jgi:Methylmalonic aciduria and homocystinuria type D protein